MKDMHCIKIPLPGRQYRPVPQPRKPWICVECEKKIQPYAQMFYDERGAIRHADCEKP
jgi:hypothetical protein